MSAVLFDLDGVLIDSRASIAACLNTVLIANGLPIRRPEEIRRFIGPPLHETFRELVGERDAARCVAEYREVYTATAPRTTRVFDGIPELLAALDGRPLAVTTSKPQAIAEPLLAALGLREHFGAVVGAPLEVDEPKAAAVARSLAALGVSSATLVGDTAYDVTAARANGVPVIGVLWGMGLAAELADADALVSTPAELLKHLRGGRAA